MLLLQLNQDIIRGCAPIADKDGHSFNDSKKSFTLASPTGTEMPLSCANSCRFSRNNCEDAQELDNQALNQAFFVSKLACVFQGPKHALQALYAKRRNRCPLAASTPARMSFHILKTDNGRAASMSLYEAGDVPCSLLSYRTNRTHQLRAWVHALEMLLRRHQRCNVFLFAPSLASQTQRTNCRPHLPTPTHA